MQFSRSGPVCRGLIVACFLLISPGRAERRPLDPPPLVEFHLEEHIDEAYRAAIESLETAAACFDDAALSGQTATFRETLDQQRLLEAGEALTLGLDDYRWNSECPRTESAAREELREKIEQIVAIVNRGRYLAHPLGVPVNFEIDHERRLYRISWREWEGDVWTGGWRGPEVVKEIPFVPKVVAVVEATYEGDRYGYRISNLQHSQAALSRKAIEIEGVGLTRELVRMHKDVPFETQRSLEDESIVQVRLPGTGYLQSYRISHYDGSMWTCCDPGETFALPPILRVPWKNLPGLTGCWVLIREWDPPERSTGLDPEYDPPNVVAFFLASRIVDGGQIGPKVQPRFAYHGKTIGPVPVPEPDERAEFVERIRGYFQEARDWGWVPDDAWAEEMAKELANLDPTEPDPRRVLRLAEEAEAAHASGRLLHEAHALLKYNLQYLAEPENWTSEE